MKVCSRPGCPQLTDQGRCPSCTRQADRTRGTAAQRGYNTVHRRQFREAVLAREPFCRLCHAPSTVADHWPESRRQLTERGANPNDPRFGRSLCKPCHDRHTAASNPGWNQPS